MGNVLWSVAAPSLIFRIPPGHAILRLGTRCPLLWTSHGDQGAGEARPSGWHHSGIWDPSSALSWPFSGNWGLWEKRAVFPVLSFWLCH